MRKSYLWVDPRGADIYYSAPGNVGFGPNGAGTAVLWAYATSLSPGALRQNRLLRIVADPSNELASALHSENFYGWAVYSGTGQRTFVAPPNYNQGVTTTGRCGWQLLAVSWDLALGQVRAFVNGDYDSGWVECGVPAADAFRLYVGPQATGAMADPTYIHCVAAWAGKLTAAQIAKLYAEGPRYVPVAEDGAGTFTFLATFSAGFGADVAEGDGELYADLCPSPDRYCRLPDGQFEYARQTYFIGQPRHDGGDFDRLPLWAVFHPGFQPATYTTDNQATEGRLVIAADPAQGDVNRGPLTPGARTSSSGQTIGLTPLRAHQPPCTLRLRLRVDSDAAPMGQRMRLGAVDYVHYPLAHANVFEPQGYGAFQAFTVADDAGNGRTVFTTNLDEAGADYWKDAYCLFLRGANAGRALKVAAYEPATKRLTLETALPNLPLAGDLGVVANWARLQGVDSDGNLGDWQALEVILDETHGSAKGYFPEVEHAYIADNWYDSNYLGRYHPNYARYDRGRGVVLEGLGWHRPGGGDATALFGRPKGAGAAGGFAATLRVQKVEVSGPWQYQLLRADGEQGPYLGDSFLVRVTAPGEQGLQPPARSVKVWRQRNVTLGLQRPTKHPDPAAVQASLKNAPWRAANAGAPLMIETASDHVVAMIVGTDAAGAVRFGYAVGHWDAGQGMPTWQDETPPVGKANPFFEGAPMSVDRAPDTPTVYGLGGAVIPLPDGKWMMAFAAKMSDPDHSQSCILLGAEDRWTFDRQRHWWRDNPLIGIRGAVDVPKLNGGGTGPWANRDGSFGVLYDRETEYPARRYLGYARGKTLLFGYDKGLASVRPLIGIRSSDGRVWSPLPEGREISPLCSPEHSTGATYIYQDSSVALGPQGGSLLISEDGVHFQDLFSGGSFLPRDEIPGEGRSLMVANTFRLGDLRIYYYYSDLGLSLATVRYGGEAYYELAAGQTEGVVETAAILRPGDAWDRELIVNADPGEGTVTVEVLDAETERAIAGFNEAHAEALPDSVEHAVRWSGLPLAEVTTQLIRLRFHLWRANPAMKAPRLYGWKLALSEPLRPRADDPKVNGQSAPAGVTDPNPVFSWSYSDPRDLAQTAYRILVASTQSTLDAGTGDIWDSGVAESAAAQAEYGGPALGSYAMYFWKPLVRNAEGVWSQ